MEDNGAALVRRSRVYVGVAAALGAVAYGWPRIAPPAASGAAFLAVFLVPLVLAAAHPVLFRRLRWRSRRQPAVFLVEAAGFRPNPAQSPYGGALIVFAAIVGARVGTLATSDEDLVLDLVGVAVFTFLAGRAARRVYRPAPLVLTRDGVVHGNQLIRWDEIRPEGPWPGPRRDWALQIPVQPAPSDTPAEPRGVSSRTWDRLRERGLDTNVNAVIAEDPSLLRPDEPVDGPAWIPVDLRGAAVDHRFLSTSIRYYRDNPRARAEIGTDVGYARLLTALSTAPSADAVRGPRSPG